MLALECDTTGSILSEVGGWFSRTGSEAVAPCGMDTMLPARQRTMSIRTEYE